MYRKKYNKELGIGGLIKTIKKKYKTRNNKTFKNIEHFQNNNTNIKEDNEICEILVEGPEPKKGAHIYSGSIFKVKDYDINDYNRMIITG